MPSNISHKILVDYFVGGDHNWVNHMMDSTVKLPRKKLNKVLPKLGTYSRLLVYDVYNG